MFLLLRSFGKVRTRYVASRRIYSWNESSKCSYVAVNMSHDVFDINISMHKYCATMLRTVTWCLRFSFCVFSSRDVTEAVYFYSNNEEQLHRVQILVPK